MSCSDEYPKTGVFYSEISNDTTIIVFLAITSLLTVICIALFLEEVVFLRRVNHGNRSKIKIHAILLGLFPIVCLMSLLSLLVPACTTLVDFLISSYLSVCIYAFVSMIVSYFGGSEAMVAALVDDKIAMNTPPCCCCLCCILKPIQLSTQSLFYLRLCSLQVVIIQPTVLLVGVILWADDNYDEDVDITSAYPYITAIASVSMLVSLYGLLVIFRGTRNHLAQYMIRFKFIPLSAIVILVNLQSLLFNILGSNGIPECIDTRGSRVRASALHHALLVIEAFLLSLVARKGYRRVEAAGNVTSVQDVQGMIIIST